MLPITQTILERYQVRKTNKQKLAFLNFLKTQLPELTVQESRFPKNRNLILGDVETCKILLTAHYDTCVRMPIPNFIMPMNPLFSLLYSLLLVVPIFVISFLISRLPGMGDFFWVFYWFFVLYLLGIGPANPHTVNDNTSGVITLLGIYAAMSEGQRQQVAIIFFDNEETGLIGSSRLRKKYKKQLKNKLLINFDCVSDGDTILMAVSKKARSMGLDLESSYTGTGKKKVLIKKAEKVLYPSDQAGFDASVAVAALHYKKGFGYYLDKIHTKRDTVLEEENIRLLRDGTLALVENWK